MAWLLSVYLVAQETGLLVSSGVEHGWAGLGQGVPPPGAEALRGAEVRPASKQAGLDGSLELRLAVCLGQKVLFTSVNSILFSDGDLKFKVKRCHTSFIKYASRAPVIVSMGT